MIPAYAISLLYLTSGIILILLGFIILRENIRQRINRITGIMMLFAGMGPIFGAFGLLLQINLIDSTQLEPFRRIFLIWEFFFPQMLLFSLIFPREIKWTKKKPYLTLFIYLPHLVHFLLVLRFSNPEQVRALINLQSLSDRFGLIIQPVTILLGLFLSLLSLIYKFHTNFFALINLIYIITTITLMVWGYRSLQNPRLKKQVGLVLWGIRASVGLYTIAFIFPHLKILPTSQAVAHMLTSIALLIGAGSIAWAIIRHQFLDIRLIIRRGLIFSFASAILIGIYLTIYGQSKKIFTGIFSLDIPLLEILFLILALLFFQPILGAIERFIERIFMRDSADYRNVLHDLSHDIMTTLDFTILQQKITSTLKGAMTLESVQLLTPNQAGNFTLHDIETPILFDQNESWIQLLKDQQTPIGFDQLSLRVNDDQALEKLRVFKPSLLIPFLHRDNMVGILILGEKITKTTFTTEDMTILSVLSNQSAIAFENAKLYEESLEKRRIEEELGLAREIQENLLPRYCSSGECFELVGYNLPSKEIGGDYYDFIPINERKLGIAIADIAGKGIPAAMLMANLQAALRVSATQSLNTHEVIQQLNIHVTQTTSAEKFATFFYGVLDTKNFSFEYTNAGHNFPILWRAEGEHTLLSEGGIIIGIMEDATYKPDQITLNSGDILIFYTDGVTEALNSHDELFGEYRLIQTIERISHLPAQKILDLILETVIDFTHGYLQTDDLTLVVLKLN